MQNIGLNTQIDELKELLQQTAKQHQYNFVHPNVVALSQKLDGLIVRMMAR